MFFFFLDLHDTFASDDSYICIVIIFYCICITYHIYNKIQNMYICKKKNICFFILFHNYLNWLKFYVKKVNFNFFLIFSY